MHFLELHYFHVLGNIDLFIDGADQCITDISWHLPALQEIHAASLVNSASEHYKTSSVCFRDVAGGGEVHLVLQVL